MDEDRTAREQVADPTGALGADPAQSLGQLGGGDVGSLGSQGENVSGEPL
jgi:hypothetical protein